VNDECQAVVICAPITVLCIVTCEQGTSADELKGLSKRNMSLGRKENGRENLDVSFTARNTRSPRTTFDYIS